MIVHVTHNKHINTVMGFDETSFVDPQEVKVNIGKRMILIRPSDPRMNLLEIQIQHLDQDGKVIFEELPGVL